jgi:hypothetical protein
VLVLVLLAAEFCALSVAVRAPAAPLAGTTWYFAEGTTLPGWTEYLTVLDPGDQPAAVVVTFLPEGQAARPVGVTVGAGDRVTLDVAATAGPGLTGVAAVVTAASPVVVERPMYLHAEIPGLGLVDGAHVAPGVAEPRVSWSFAEGTTLPGFREYITLLDPLDAGAIVTLTYDDGTSGGTTRQIVLGGHSRRTIDVAGSGEGALGAVADGVAVRIESSAPIVAERPFYVDRPFGARGVIAGAAIGSPAAAPSARWSFAEGTTLDGFVEWIAVQPGDGPSVLAFDYRIEGGGTETRRCRVEGHTRLTVPVFDPTEPCGLGRDIANGSLSEGVALTVRVESGPPVVAERSLYYATSLATGMHIALGVPGDRLPAERYFAEGTTRAGFSGFWTFDNASDRGVPVAITYFVSGGGRIERSLTVTASARLTVALDDAAAGGAGPGLDFGARIRSLDGSGIDVERPLYVNGRFSDGDVGGGVVLTGTILS